MEECSPDPDEVTALLREFRAFSGDEAAELLPVVYGELRRLARARLRDERPDHTLSPTALVHEAYLKLAGRWAREYQDRAHFFAVAATAMRRVLIDHARARQAEKRGGNAHFVTLGAQDGAETHRLDEILALDEALDALAALDGRQAKVVEYRYFAGLTQAEIASMLDISVATVERDWRSARAWLRRALAEPS